MKTWEHILLVSVIVVAASAVTAKLPQDSPVAEPPVGTEADARLAVKQFIAAEMAPVVIERDWPSTCSYDQRNQHWNARGAITSQGGLTRSFKMTISTQDGKTWGMDSREFWIRAEPKYFSQND